MNDIIRSLILGVVEGVTEFLPVSSTGHMRLLGDYWGPLVSPEFSKTFDVFIQIGAIIAVVVYFRAKIADVLGIARRPVNPEAAPTAPAEPKETAAQRRNVQKAVLLGTLPLFLCFPILKWSDEFFQDKPGLEAKAIAAALAIGGLLMIVIELLPRRPRTRSMEAITWKQALVAGFAQVLAGVFPGTSRSAATIMGSMMGGMDRATAAEFSFFLAIPAMFAAAGYKLLKFFKNGGADLYQSLLLVIGTVTAFMVAYVVIAAFMGFIRKYTFVPFGLYRILLGVAVLLMV